jgi:hypothetical protein
MLRLQSNFMSLINYSKFGSNRRWGRFWSYQSRFIQEKGSKTCKFDSHSESSGHAFPICKYQPFSSEFQQANTKRSRHKLASLFKHNFNSPRSSSFASVFSALLSKERKRSQLRHSIRDAKLIHPLSNQGANTSLNLPYILSRTAREIKRALQAIGLFQQQIPPAGKFGVLDANSGRKERTCLVDADAPVPSQKGSDNGSSLPQSSGGKMLPFSNPHDHHHRGDFSSSRSLLPVLAITHISSACKPLRIPNHGAGRSFGPFPLLREARRRDGRPSRNLSPWAMGRPHPVKDSRGMVRSCRSLHNSYS